MRQRNGRKNRAGCGNDGAVETMENQTTVFHRSHRSLEIRRTAPDSHIPTASTTGLFFSSRTRKPSRSSGALRARNPSSQLNNPANGEISPFRIILGLEYAPGVSRFLCALCPLRVCLSWLFLAFLSVSASLR